MIKVQLNLTLNYVSKPLGNRGSLVLSPFSDNLPGSLYAKEDY